MTNCLAIITDQTDTNTCTDYFTFVGGHISSAQDFFSYCETFLKQDAFSSTLSNKVSFTSGRRFHLLASKDLAEYRSQFPKIATWVGLQRAEGWYSFMPQQGKGAGYLSRQWLACVCDRCMADDFENCKHRDFLTAAGKWWNKPEMKHLPGMAHTQQTKKMCIKKSLTVFSFLSFMFIQPDVLFSFFQFMTEVTVGQFIAIRPDETPIEDLDGHVNSDDEEEASYEP